MGNVLVNGYSFDIDDKMKKLIEEGVVLVVAYEDDGHIPAKPFVELQTDLDKTNLDYCEFVDKFQTYEEANLCVKEVADYLHIPFRTIQIS